jgi:hypothetical protein
MESRFDPEVVELQVSTIEQLAHTEQPEKRLALLQYISQYAYDLPVELLWFIAAEHLGDRDFRIRGEICYALGRSERPLFVQLLEQLLGDPHHWVCEQAEKAIERLKQATPQPTIGSNGIKLLCLKQVSSRVDGAAEQLLQALVYLALNDRDAQVRSQACRLVSEWSAVDQRKAEHFEPLFHQICLDDSDPKAPTRASDAVQERLAAEMEYDPGLSVGENSNQVPVEHLPILRQKREILVMQIGRLEKRMQVIRSGRERSGLEVKHNRKQRRLRELDRQIQAIEDSLR